MGLQRVGIIPSSPCLASTKRIEDCGLESAASGASQCDRCSSARARSPAGSGPETTESARSPTRGVALESIPTLPPAARHDDSRISTSRSCARPPRSPRGTSPPADALKRQSFPVCGSHCCAAAIDPPDSPERGDCESSDSPSRKWFHVESGDSGDAEGLEGRTDARRSGSWLKRPAARFGRPVLERSFGWPGDRAFRSASQGEIVSASERVSWSHFGEAPPR